MDLIIELAISWLVLRLALRKDLLVLGILPSGKRMMQFTVGFFGACFICGFNFFLQSIFSGTSWAWNNAVSPKSILNSVWWILHSVLYEELIFRGAFLYVAIQKIGIKRACILSAVAFGIYHWFSMNALGQWVPMTYFFVVTGIMGYQFALAYAKTNSLYLPIGIHFGWNLMSTLFFSQGPLGNQLLIPEPGERFSMIENIIVMLISNFALPLITFLYLRWVQKDRVNQAMIKI